MTDTYSVERPNGKVDKPNAMDEKTLLKILRDEESDATSFYSSELAKDQAEAMKRYYAEPYGDEIEGWSKVTTQDLADVIDWIMPDLRRVFLNSEDLMSLKASRPSDKHHLKDAAAYMKHVFFEDNDGENIVRSFAFDGLLQKIGVVSVRYEPGEKEPPEVFKGVTPEQLADFDQDPEYEILAQDEEQQIVDGIPMPLFTLQVQRTPSGRCIIDPVPPEEFRASRRARSVEAADYLARHREEYVGDLARLFPDKKRELLDGNLMTSSEHDIEVEGDIRREERFNDEPEDVYRSMNVAEGRKKVTLLEEYVRVDYDGDGITELLHVKRVGNVILEKMPVEEAEFAIWSPIFVAHKMIGRSMADRMVDIQKIRTVTTRSALDNIALALRPRLAVNRALVDDDSIDQLLDHEIGGIVEVDGDARAAVANIVVPDMSDSAFKMLEHWDQELEKRSGVTRHAQGLDPDAITKTMGGQQLLQNASATRKEDIAALLALGLEEIFKLMLKCLCRNQDHARIIEVNEEWVPFDPRRWSDQMLVKIHPAQGTGSRETQITNLSIIAGKQETVLAAMPQNPIVTLKEYQATCSRLVEAMGFNNPDTFFKPLPDDWQPPEPGPDPETVKAQGEIQLKQQAQQADQQMDMAKLQAQTAAEQQKMQTESALKREEMLMELDLQVKKSEAEMQLRREQIAEELQLKREQVAAELALKREQIAAELKLKEQTSDSVNTSEVRPGGDAG